MGTLSTAPTTSEAFLRVDWSRAACAPLGPDDAIWYSSDHSPPRAAAKVCADCPILADCLAYAIDHEPWGVWGGASALQRDRMMGRRTHRA